MTESATILIPDISGYTEFVTKTEMEHSSQIILKLLDTIVKSVSDDFVVSDIEGDAVLLYKKGSPPSKKDLIDQCVKTFTAFHRATYDEWANSLCQCGACQRVADLTLKFIVHFGNIAEIKVAQFMHATGADMVVAHRLLKNNINDNEYVLTTDSYLKNVPDSGEPGSLKWTPGKEEYPSLGVIEFHFASLTPVKQKFPESAMTHTTAVSLEGREVLQERVEINAPYFDVHEAILNIDIRIKWADGLRAGAGPAYLAVGTKYLFAFNDGMLEIEPRHVESSTNKVIYEEYATIADASYYAIYHFEIKALDKTRTLITLSVLPQTGHTFSDGLKKKISENIRMSLHNLRALFGDQGVQNQ